MSSEFPKVKMTDEGGIAIKLTNKTGSNSVAGEIVQPDPSVDNAFEIAPTDGINPIGVVYEDGIADGSECWVVIAGIADILIEDGTAATRGNFVRTGSTTAGRADMASGSPASQAVHFQEVGHCIESKGSGTDVKAKAMIHFN
jgi:hypothetical protein